MVIDTNSSPEEEESESSDGSGDVISFASEPPKPEPVLHVTPKKQPVTSSGNSSNNTPVRVSPAEKPHSTTAPGPASRKRKSLSESTVSLEDCSSLIALSNYQVLLLVKLAPSKPG